MTRLLITFSGSPYDPITAQVMRDARSFGVDDVLVYDDVWLKQSSFYAQHKWLWSFERGWGCGWNAWKPFIILNALERHPDAVILYVDGDTRPIADLSPIFNCARVNGLMLFEAQGVDNRRFTRRDCFVAMGCDSERYWDARHACGRFSAWRNNAIPQQLLWEWYTYSVNPWCQGWGPSITPEQDFSQFHRHSAEQSVLTILAAKWGIPLHREACQFGWPASPGHGQPDDTYPQLFEQIGERAPETNQGSRFRNV
jgi:hypothetical protein